MKPINSRPSLEDVLNAFAVEADPGPETLGRYLRDYPEYASDLEELSRELMQPLVVAAGPLSIEDTALINAAWQRYRSAASALRVNPFASLTVPRLREIASALGVRRQVISAFSERKVILASIPKAFLAGLASALGIEPSGLEKYLSSSPTQGLAMSYKSEEKPIVSMPVTFEQILIDSGMTEAERAKLLTD